MMSRANEAFGCLTFAIGSVGGRRYCRENCSSALRDEVNPSLTRLHQFLLLRSYVVTLARTRFTFPDIDVESRSLNLWRFHVTLILFRVRKTRQAMGKPVLMQSERQGLAERKGLSRRER
jgi:hypothetical protein